MGLCELPRRGLARTDLGLMLLPTLGLKGLLLTLLPGLRLLIGLLLNPLFPRDVRGGLPLTLGLSLMLLFGLTSGLFLKLVLGLMLVLLLNVLLGLMLRLLAINVKYFQDLIEHSKHKQELKCKEMQSGPRFVRMIIYYIRLSF